MKIKNTYTAGNESMQFYYSTIAKSTPLTQQEECALAKRIHAGDQKALDELVCANMKFVISVAGNYQNMGLDLYDLVQEGNIGLIKAATKFDETRGVKFISFAVHYIQQAINDALEQTSRTIRLPHNLDTLISRIKNAESSIEQREHRPATLEETAEQVGVSPMRVLEVLKADAYCTKLQSKLSDREDALCLGDTLRIADTDSIDSYYDELARQQDFEDMLLSTTDERERFIITHLFGIKCEKLEQQQIAKELGLSRERVRQIQNLVFKKMKEYYKTRKYHLCG